MKRVLVIGVIPTLWIPFATPESVKPRETDTDLIRGIRETIEETSRLINILGEAMQESANSFKDLMEVLEGMPRYGTERLPYKFKDLYRRAKR